MTTNFSKSSFADEVVVVDTDYTVFIVVCSVTLGIVILVILATSALFFLRRRQTEKASDHHDQESPIRRYVGRERLYSRSNYPLPRGIDLQQDAAADEDYVMERRGRLGRGGASSVGSQDSLTEREEQSVRNIRSAIEEIIKVRRLLSCSVQLTVFSPHEGVFNVNNFHFSLALHVQFYL